ncbi:hypothetical protein GGI06_000620 [Coemansia sp. S85]|nr:hypothetical protein GGI06_000620 [Coemansia sp. S85]
MTPRLKKVSIKIAPSDGSDFRLPVPLFNSLLAHLSKPVTEIAYELHSLPITIDQQLSGLTNLHFATMDTRGGGKQITQLARRNASTLQKLRIGVHIFTEIAGLFKNPGGGYVQCPRLQMLRLSDWQDDDDSQQTVFPGAVPFPNLRFLDLEYFNVFGDDTIFRGNAGTLECLLIMPSPQTLKALREHNVFTPTSHPKLHYVSFGMKLRSAQDPPRADVEYIRFLLSIGASAPVRFIREDLAGHSIKSMLPALGEHACIQVLTLSGFRLNLWGILALVKQLPLLSDVHSLISVPLLEIHIGI